MNQAELAEYDGREGRAAYVAVSGVIYDVSASPHWADGEHLRQHQAGADLTEDLQRAPHVRTLIERFPVVGRLEALPPQKTGKNPLWLVAAAAAVGTVLFLLLR